MLISLVVTLVVLAIFYWVLSLIPLPYPYKLVLQVIFGLIAALVLLDAFGLYHSGLVVPSLH